jgi:hypothetical protein
LTDRRLCVRLEEVETAGVLLHLVGDARGDGTRQACRSPRLCPSPICLGGTPETVDQARLEIALTVCDGVLQISITVADPAT